jgi:signal transduction histidine kinase
MVASPSVLERVASLPWPGIASFRQRILLRGVFLLLAVATLAMAVTLLQEEKALSYRNYQTSFRKTQEQVSSRLHHPAGQLALLNPAAASVPVTPLHPYVLPYAAIDFDDASKVQQAVETTGCLVQYRQYGAVCVAVGSNPWAGGFIYIAGRFASDDLVGRSPGERDLRGTHRVRVTLDMRGQTSRWVAPFERMDRSDGGGATSPSAGIRGRLAGFIDTDGPDMLGVARPVRDFRGWAWQSSPCIDTADTATGGRCRKGTFFSIRLPVEVFREALFREPRPDWPPADLEKTLLRVEVYAPGGDASTPIFDSNAEGATPPFSLNDLRSLLLPGETLRVKKVGGSADLVKLAAVTDDAPEAWPWIDRLIRQLPVEGFDTALEAKDVVSTALGSYEVTLTGDVRGVNRALASVATRMSWFVGAMLTALAVAWLVVEVGIIRRIAELTRRARAVSAEVRSEDGVRHFNVADLRGKDELGILASCLHDLLQRVNEDVRREHLRAERERDTWHAVGHEIMSPLQSLMVLHGEADDPSARYIHRMQQAIRVLYGSASPSEAFQSSQLRLDTLDLNEFLAHVATNAQEAGVASVRFVAGSSAGAVKVRADEYSLEDVLTHLLTNADRHRAPGSDITITLEVTGDRASVRVHNAGEQIPAELFERIFEYGVSDPKAATGEAGNTTRGQGLFVARTYMAKMGGTVTARNEDGGVTFELLFPLAG